jgi:hypothetical protein
MDGDMPKAQAVRDAQRHFEGLGLFEGRQEDVHLRYAGNSEAVYIDLANDAWEQIRITKEGWGIIKAEDTPVKFKRAKGMLPLCYPGETSATMEDIGRFFNVKTENDLVLIVSWLLGAMQPEGPFPILVLQGEQGSAKSTTARLLSRTSSIHRRYLSGPCPPAKETWQSRPARSGRSASTTFPDSRSGYPMLSADLPLAAVSAPGRCSQTTRKSSSTPAVRLS